jgi:alkylation response protein AidB-like acyl-CoA dehydrogenase
MSDELLLSMDSQLLATGAQTVSAESMRTFVHNEIQPTDAVFRRGGFTRDQLLELTQAVAEFGLPGGAVPRQHGGLGMSWETQARLFEELARGSPRLAGVVLVNMLVASLLVRNPALRERYLDDLITGRSIAGLGIDAGSPSSRSALRACRTARGFVVDGTGEGIESSEWSDFLVCAAQIGNGGAYLLLDRARHRYETRATNPTRERLPAEHRVVVAEAELEAAHFISDAGRDSDTTRHLLDALKLHEGVASVAQAQKVLDVTIAHATQRMQFGRPLAAQSLVAMQIAEMASLIESARLMCDRGLGLLDARRHCEKESSMARGYAHAAAARVYRRATQIAPRGLSEHHETLQRDFEAGMRLVISGDCESDAQVVARAVTGVSVST